MIVEFLWRTKLLDETAIEHGNAAPHRHSLGLVVRHINNRRLNALVKLGYVCTCLDAQFRIQVGERLVHQEDLWLTYKFPTKRDALALGTGEFLWLSLQEGSEGENFTRLLHPLLYLIFWGVAEP